MVSQADDPLNDEKRRPRPAPTTIATAVTIPPIRVGRLNVAKADAEPTPMAMTIAQTMGCLPDQPPAALLATGPSYPNAVTSNGRHWEAWFVKSDLPTVLRHVLGVAATSDLHRRCRGQDGPSRFS